MSPTSLSIALSSFRRVILSHCLSSSHNVSPVSRKWLSQCKSCTVPFAFRVYYTVSISKQRVLFEACVVDPDEKECVEDCTYGKTAKGNDADDRDNCVSCKDSLTGLVLSDYFALTPLSLVVCSRSAVLCSLPLCSICFRSARYNVDVDTAMMLTGWSIARLATACLSVLATTHPRTVMAMTVTFVSSATRPLPI